MTEIEPCPKCGALPCDWTDNPHTAPSGDEVERVGLQAGVHDWMMACFGAEIAADKLERADRFIEEALELAQTMPGFSAGRAHALVDYVFNRPQGEINQEVGGVMITLAALCNTMGVDIASEADRELARIWTKVEQIRAKQAAKPTGSALPIAQAAIAAMRPVVEEEQGWLIEEQNGGFTHWIALAKDQWPRTKTSTRRARMNADLDLETITYKSPVIRVKDASDALRFARKEDAEAMIALFGGFLLHAVATEHVWCDGAALRQAGEG